MGYRSDHGPYIIHKLFMNNSITYLLPHLPTHRSPEVFGWSVGREIGPWVPSWGGGRGYRVFGSRSHLLIRPNGLWFLQEPCTPKNHNFDSFRTRLALLNRWEGALWRTFRNYRIHFSRSSPIDDRKVPVESDRKNDWLPVTRVVHQRRWVRKGRPKVLSKGEKQ